MTDLKSAATDLEKAMTRLEDSVEHFFDKTLSSRLAHAEAEALRRDRAQLAQDLDASRARERELEALADEASKALGIAITEVRAALESQDQSETKT